MQVGEILEASVTEIKSYGVWVSIGNQRALIQIPNITWESFSVKIEDYVSIGDNVKVKILGVNGDDIFASIKDAYPNENPWLHPPEIEDVFNAKVVLVAEYGYILCLEENLYGILHIDHASRAYKKGQTVLIQVSEVDIERRKVNCNETSKNL